MAKSSTTPPIFNTYFWQDDKTAYALIIVDADYTLTKRGQLVGQCQNPLTLRNVYIDQMPIKGPS